MYQLIRCSKTFRLSDKKFQVTIDGMVLKLTFTCVRNRKKPHTDFKNQNSLTK